MLSVALLQLALLQPTPPALQPPALSAVRCASRVQRAREATMKGVAGHRFNLAMWYGDSAGDADVEHGVWVSPWAKAHYKLRQQEIEIEQCEFMLKQAVDEEDYSEAGGLSERVERLRSMHPILPREARLEEALAEGDYAMAAIFQNDLERIKENLGLPRYNVGQAVIHRHRAIRGIVLDIDLVCSKPDKCATTQNRPRMAARVSICGGSPDACCWSRHAARVAAQVGAGGGVRRARARAGIPRGGV